MANKFGDMLKGFKSLLRFSATGNSKGHIITVRPKEDTDDSKASFKKLMGIVSGGIVMTTILLFKSILEASRSQVMGAISAEPVSGHENEIALSGFCMEFHKDPPDHTEDFTITDSATIPEKSIQQFLVASKEFHSAFDEDFIFLQRIDREGFNRCFDQTGIWVITDNIGFVDARRSIFRPDMFFSLGPMEIMFGLRECLKKAVPNYEKLTYNKELLEACWYNHWIGFIPDEKYKEWEERFGFV